MDIKQEKENLRKREEPVVRELNQVIGQEKALAARKKELVDEALRLNGEARLLNKLSDNGKKQKK